MTLDGIAGRLALRPGAVPSIACTRPMIGADMMRRLTEGRRAVLLPDLIGAVFSLCAMPQRATSRRAIRAAAGLHDSAAEQSREALVLALVTARDHLQRLALDLPTLLPRPGAAADAHWLRDAPVMGLPAHAAGPAEAAWRSAAAALPGWLERRLLGMPPGRWLEGWRDDGDAWLTHWATAHEHPVTAWLRAVRDEARAFALPCRALDLQLPGEAGPRALAAALAADQAFAERPRWQGAPAETGPWTRAGRADPVATPWQRLGARIADLLLVALLSQQAPLAAGACTVGPGEGIAWTEMSRGLLVHWVQLEPGTRSLDVARAAACRVLPPTEWNFHPDGALGRALAQAGTTPAQARLAAVAMDPCLAFDVQAEPRHA